jgi:hypothetical protein
MLLNAQKDFIAGRIYAIRNRLALAQRRIEKAPEGTTNKVEEERAKRLSKVLELHVSNPEEAITLYNK